MFTLRFLSWFSFLALLGVGFHSAAIAQVSPAVSVPMLRPLVQVRQAEQAIRLGKAEVRVQISGGLAVTRVHLSLHNPIRRDLEGELQFAALDGEGLRRLGHVAGHDQVHPHLAQRPEINLQQRELPVVVA
jgi:hypothetical protein